MARKGAMKKDPPARSQPKKDDKPAAKKASPSPRAESKPPARAAQPAATRAPARTTPPPAQTKAPARQATTQSSARTAPSKWTRTGAGTYKDQYGNVLRGQSKAPTQNMAGRTQQPGGAGTPGARAGTQPTGGGTGSPPTGQRGQTGQAGNKRAPSKWTRTGPGTYKDQYGNVLRGQKTAPKRDMSQRGQPKTEPQPGEPPAIGETPGTEAPPFYEQPPMPTEPPPGTPFEELPIEQQFGEMGDVGGELYIGMGEYAQQFDPRTFQQQYDPGFSQEMERARQNVMSQFERRNQRQFEQQRLSVQQQIAERGLDPASPAAQELMRQQNERETFAQQEAMSAAEQAAQGIQQQMYQQATGVALLPGQIAGQFMDPLMAQYGQAGRMEEARFGAQAGMELERLRQQGQQGMLTQEGQQRMAQLERELQARAQEQRKQIASQERIARITRSGGGGGAPQGPNLYARMEAERLGSGYGQGQTVNPGAAFGQGVAAGAGQGITNWMNRK